MTGGLCRDAHAVAEWKWTISGDKGGTVEKAFTGPSLRAKCIVSYQDCGSRNPENLLTLEWLLPQDGQCMWTVNLKISLPCYISPRFISNQYYRTNSKGTCFLVPIFLLASGLHALRCIMKSMGYLARMWHFAKLTLWAMHGFFCKECVWQLHELRNLWSISRLQLTISAWKRRNVECAWLSKDL